jgi:hypothetical protein
MPGGCDNVFIPATGRRGNVVGRVGGEQFVASRRQFGPIRIKGRRRNVEEKGRKGIRPRLE